MTNQSTFELPLKVLKKMNCSESIVDLIYIGFCEPYDSGGLVLIKYVRSWVANQASVGGPELD
jgi:hypothetical protein